VDKRIRVNHLDCRREAIRGIRNIVTKNTTRHEEQDRTDPLSASQHTISSSLPDLTLFESSRRRETFIEYRLNTYSVALVLIFMKIDVIHLRMAPYAPIDRQE
jgi:hypothetical protein